MAELCGTSAATIGVPIKWSTPILMSEEERQCPHFRLFATYLSAPVHAADMIALLIREYPTNSVYNTQGGVSPTGVLVQQEMRWIITPIHRARLKAIYLRTKSTLLKGQSVYHMQDLINLDMSFRIKKARGNTRSDEKVLVYFECTLAIAEVFKPGTKQLLAQWFDIADNCATNLISSQRSFETASEKQARAALVKCIVDGIDQDRVPRICQTCKVPDQRHLKHRQCSKCGVVYCNVQCQTKDWPVHRRQCPAAPGPLLSPSLAL